MFDDMHLRTYFLVQVIVYCLKEEEAGVMKIYKPIVIFYIIKQDIRIYVPYSWPNGWTDWAEIFCGHSWVAGGCYRL